MLIFAVVFVVLVAGLLAWGKVMAFEPEPVMPMPVVSLGDAPLLQKGQKLKVMSWNIQFLAGKGHIFYFDMQGNKGPEEKPSQADIERTLPEVVRIIREENPDVVLLQEVDDGAARTYGQDQLERILGLLPKQYTQHTSAFYWKMPYVPHPRIRGSVGMKLSVISRVKMSSATRFSLPRAPQPPVVSWFQFHRAMLEVRLPVQGGGEVVLMNSHLEPFIQTGTVKQQELDFLQQHFMALKGTPWIFGADMNMLPPGFYDRIPEEEKVWFHPKTDAGPLYAKYPGLPSLGDLNGPDSLANRTHYPNRPDATGLDKTIDFIFHSPNMVVDSFQVRQYDTQKISDHAPLVGVFSGF